MIIQLANNWIASYFFVTMVALALAGQLLALRVVSLSLVIAIVCGAYGAGAVTFCLGSDSALLQLTCASLIGAVVAVVGGWIDAWFCLRSEVLVFLASLGLVKVIQGLVTATTGGGIETLTFPVPSLMVTSGFLASPTWLWAGLGAMAFCATGQGLLLHSTRVGTSAYAIGDDPILAALFGVPIRRTHLIIQAVGGTIAGLAGLFLAADSGLRPDLGFATAIKAFGVLIAARGRFGLVFLWGGVLVVLEEITAYFWGGQLREAAGLLFLVAALIVARSPVRGGGHLRKSKSLTPTTAR